MERKDKDLQHLSHISEKPSEVSVDASAHGLYNRNVQGFDNPGYESQSVHSDNYRVMESVISPPRRSSVIYIFFRPRGPKSSYNRDLP